MARKLQPSTLKRKARAKVKTDAVKEKFGAAVVGRAVEETRRLVVKQLCQLSLYEFMKEAWPVVEPEKQFMDNWHIVAMCDHLQAVTEGRIKNLLINIPPGCMKSLLVSVFWPCWEWARFGGRRWFFASYDIALSLRDAAKCRTLLESSWFQSQWSLKLKDDQNQKGLYENDLGGWRLATTVGGRGTGHHPDRKVVDDPHNVKKAESEAERQGVIDWIDGTLSSRGMLSDPSTVIVMQRLNSKDASGHVIGKGGFDHLCLPMRYEPDHPFPVKSSLGFKDPRQPGELLWPLALPEAKVKELEDKMGQYFTAGQFQQRPHPRGGGMFKREWFTHILPTRPTDVLKWVRYWDKAGTAGGEGARSAGCLMGRRRNGRFVIADIMKGRWSSTDREAIIKSTAAIDANRHGFGVEIWVEQEPGSGGKESAENTVKNLVGYRCKIERVTGAKEVRAEPFAAQCSIGNVDLVAGDWNEEYISEAESFPAGSLKDQVDCSGGAFNKLAAGSGAFGLSSVLTSPGGAGPDGLEVGAVEFDRINPEDF